MRSYSDFETEIRRKALRLNKKASYPWQLHINEDFLITKNIINLSALGLSFCTPETAHFQLGDKLQLKLTLDSETSLELFGRVVWSSLMQESSRGFYKYGIEFVEMPIYIDTLISKKINEYIFLERREYENNKSKVLPQLSSQKHKKQSIHRPLAKNVFALVAISAVAAALIAGLYAHERKFSDKTLAERVTEFFDRR